MNIRGGDRVDLRELALQAAREEALSKRTDALQLITFGRNADPQRMDPIGRHPLNGRPIFPDKKRLGATIKAGETYFCDLAEYRPASGPSVYYANPIIKIDAAYLSELRPDQLGKIVELLWKSDGESLLKVAEQRIRSDIKQERRSEIQEATEPSAPGVEASRRRSGAMAIPLEPSVARSDEGSREQRIESYSVGLEERESSQVMVDRPSAESIKAPQIADGRYRVFVSPDRRRLLVAPSPSGAHVANDGLLRLPGLALLRPFNLPETLSGIHDTSSGNVSILI